MADRSNLSNLAIAASDELNRLARLQIFIDLCLEQFDDEPDETGGRVELLLESYSAAVRHHLNELETHLTNIRKLLAVISPPPDSN